MRSSKKKRLSVRTFLIFGAAYLCAFHLSLLSSAAGAYAYSFFSLTVRFLTLPALCLCATVLPGGAKAGNVLRALLAPAAAPLLGALPGYYLLSLSGASDSLEALFFSLLFCLCEYAATVLVCFLISLGVRALVTRRGWDGDPASLFGSSFFDLSGGGAFAGFCLSLLPFAFFFVIEICDAVGYLVSYGGTSTLGEIGYMVIRFLFLLLLWVVSLALFFRAGRSAVTGGEKHGEV